MAGWPISRDAASGNSDTWFIQFLRDNVVREFSICSAFGFSARHDQAPQLNPFPGKKSVVVTNNCSIHHDPQVKELIEGECGMYKHNSLLTHHTVLITKQAHDSGICLHILKT